MKTFFLQQHLNRCHLSPTAMRYHCFAFLTERHVIKDYVCRWRHTVVGQWHATA